ncbi:MAG TPA: hypothetical protein VJT83_10015 [Chitinophagaceae bacterium]|nr:hypothetical protein [Chitinophagaceae bacterium]
MILSIRMLQMFITVVLICFLADEAGAQSQRCPPGKKLDIRYDNVIDLEGASNFAYDSVLYHFNGNPGKAVDGARWIYDIYNDSAYYGAGRRKGRKVLIALPQIAMIDSVRGLDSSNNITTVNVYFFKKITASDKIHSTYDSILNAHAYKPNYSWSTSGGATIGYRWLQRNMRDTTMYLLFNFMDAQRMSFEFFGCYVKSGGKENLILPVTDTITYSYRTIGDLSGSNVTQIGSEKFLADTLSFEKPNEYRKSSAAFRFYDHPMYYDTSTSEDPRDWKLNMGGAGNLDNLAAVKYGLRSIQSTRGGQGKTIRQAGTWEVRQTNNLTDNPELIDNYKRIAKFHTQMTAKKGRNKNIQYTRDSLNYANADTITFGLNINVGREIGNEEDKEWIPWQTAKPQHIFAKMAAVYDGDRGRLGRKTGIKTMDSTMDVIYPGVVSFRTEWIRASITWSKLYYGDRKVPWDVIGYHLGTSNRIFTKSPTANEIIGLKGTFPEYFDDGARLNYVIRLFSRLIGRQARVNFSEYAVSQAYDWPKSADQAGYVSSLATPLYDGFDDLKLQHNVAWNSAAINILRQFLVITETPADGAAAYEFHDNSGFKLINSYKGGDQSNGKYSAKDTVALWPRFWLLNGFIERAKDYKFEKVILKEGIGGRYVTKYRSVINTDSVMIIVRKRDTSGPAIQYRFDVGNAKPVLKFIPGLNDLKGEQSLIIPGSTRQVPASAGLMPVMYFYREKRE